MGNDVDTAVKIGAARYIPACLGKFGIAPEPFLAGNGLTMEELSNPEHSISFSQLAQLFNSAATATNCPEFGLLVGLCGGPHTLEPKPDGASHTDLLTAAFAFLDTPNSWFNENAYLFVQSMGERSSIKYVITNPMVESGRQISEAAIAVVYNVLKSICGPSWTIESASFTRPAVGDRHSLADAFDAPIQFNSSVVSLEFASRWLGATPSGRLPPRLRPAIMPNSLPEAVVCTCYGRFMDGTELKSARVARELGMSRRTLHRRLASLDTSFQTLLNRARLGAAQRLLKDTSMSVTDIAYLVGYSDISAFTRAFSQWRGHSPSHLRRDARREPGDH